MIHVYLLHHLIVVPSQPGRCPSENQIFMFNSLVLLLHMPVEHNYPNKRDLRELLARYEVLH